MIFQDPFNSLDPRRTIAASIAEPLRRTGAYRSTRARVAELLELVQLPGALASRYPAQLSGGQRQRVALARALATDAQLLVADEPTSALDVSIQKSILELLLRLRDQLKFGCLFITHDLAVVAEVADEVVVMHDGAVIEHGPVSTVLYDPAAAYTRLLIESAPVPDPRIQAERRAAARRLEEVR